MAYTPEEKKQWHQKMNGLIKQVSALTPEKREEMAKRMPIVTSEGHVISAYNACFLTMQTELPLTIIGGFRQWKVRKDSKARLNSSMKASMWADVPIFSRKLH